MKRCSKCKTEKPLDDFSNNRAARDGKNNWCKQCFNSWKHDKYEELAGRPRKKTAPKSLRQGFKICSLCFLEKPLTEFSKNSSMRDMKNPYCKTCDKEYRSNRRTTIPRIKELEKAKRQTQEHKQKKRDRYRLNMLNPEFADKKRKQNSAWSKANRDKINPRHRKDAIIRNKRSRNAPGNFTKEEFDDLCESVGGICLCCGKKSKLTVDHVVPLSRGGSNDISNIQPLCASCNSKKRTKTIDYRPQSALKVWPPLTDGHTAQ